MPNESAHNAFPCEAYERFFVPTLLLEATLRSVSVKEGWQPASKDSMIEKSNTSNGQAYFAYYGNSVVGSD